MRKLSDLNDYLHWRGDLTFDAVDVCEADYTVFCALSYFPFDDFVRSGFGRKTRLGDVLKKIDLSVREGAEAKKTQRSKKSLKSRKDADTGNNTKPEKAPLEYFSRGDDVIAASVMGSPRFEQLGICGFINKIDTEQQEQFCAMTFVLPTGDVVVTFRGTDHTIVGWKEDFNMGFMSELPSQKDAVKYLHSVAKAFPKAGIYVCGHSKGGNLAMYASFFCNKAIQDRILQVRNLDGPGFMEGVLEREGARTVIDRTKTYVPQSSVVGMLLAHEEPYHVVHSTNYSLLQHYLNSWEITRGTLVEEAGTTNSSQIVDRTLKDWVAAMSIEQRGKLIDGFYEIVLQSDAKTLEELTAGKSTLAMLKAMGKLDPEQKELFKTAYRIFKKSLKKSIPTGKLFTLSAKDAVPAGRAGAK